MAITPILDLAADAVNTNILLGDATIEAATASARTEV